MNKNVLATIRIVLGLIFLWAFFDKLFGLGYTTQPDQAWIKGVSPTAAFLSHTLRGPAAELCPLLVGNPVVDWLFMLGLLGVGLAMTLGIGLTIAGYAGALMMLLIYLSLFPLANNPLFDEHVVYALLLVGFARSNDLGSVFGLGTWWSHTKLVKRFPVLR